MKEIYNDIKKYLDQVDLIEYYITKNICKLIKNKKDKKIIYKNKFLLAINNKNNKTSLDILLENNENTIILDLIKDDYTILDFKNKNEINFLTKLLESNFFYDKFDNIFNNIIKDDDIFKLKILSDVNIDNNNFIDKIISIINSNSNENIFTKTNIIEIIKLIYSLGKEDKLLLITKITRDITNEKILNYIFDNIKLINFDIYPDDNLLTCVDYLILHYNLEVLYKIIDNINYVYFININTNSLINLLQEFLNDDNKLILPDLDKLIKLIFKILEKSNISKIKNNKNQNIFFVILKLIKIDYKILSNYLVQYDIDLFDQDIDGVSLFNIINKKYNSEEKQYIINNKKEKNLLTKIYKNDNYDLTKLLIQSNIGIFSSDIIHNILYTILFLEKYKNLGIPYFFQNNKYLNKQKILLDLSNNDKYISNYLKIYFYNFNLLLPHLIIWKNKNNYFIDPNLLIWIRNNNYNNFVYIKLSINLLNKENSRHANLIIIDNVNKIIERFEPYGEINYYNSIDLNNFIINVIAKPLNYKFKFIQSYPGFQTRSDDLNKFNKTYGDPFGYCLAWCFLYLEIKLLINNKNVNPIDIINNYIINKFKNNYAIVDNVYLTFIRYYAINLDKNKNMLLNRYKIDPSILYHNNIDNKKYMKIITKLNEELMNIIKNKN